MIVSGSAIIRANDQKEVITLLKKTVEGVINGWKMLFSLPESIRFLYFYISINGRWLNDDLRSIL